MLHFRFHLRLHVRYIQLRHRNLRQNILFLDLKIHRLFRFLERRSSCHVNHLDSLRSLFWFGLGCHFLLVYIGVYDYIFTWGVLLSKFRVLGHARNFAFRAVDFVAAHKEYAKNPDWHKRNHEEQEIPLSLIFVLLLALFLIDDGLFFSNLNLLLSVGSHDGEPKLIVLLTRDHGLSANTRGRQRRLAVIDQVYIQSTQLVTTVKCIGKGREVAAIKETIFVDAILVAKFTTSCALD